MSAMTYEARRSLPDEQGFGYRRPAPRRLIEPVTLGGFPAPGRHVIVVAGPTLECTCGLGDYAGSLSVYNHAIYHGGAFVSQPAGTIWVDRDCFVDGEQICKESSHEH